MSSNLMRGWNVSPIKIFFYTCSTDVKADDIQSTHAGSSVSPVMTVLMMAMLRKV